MVGGGLMLAGQPGCSDPDASRGRLPDTSAEHQYIDAHVHVWTAQTDLWPIAGDFQSSDMQPASFPPDELLSQYARPNGVARVVLIQMSYYGYNNSYMLYAIAMYPGVFSGVARVKEDQRDPLQEMRALAKRGVRGFRITADGAKPDQAFDTPAMHAMWKYGGQEKLAMCPLINPEYLPSVARMCEQHGDTTVVIDHFARVGMAGPVSDEQVQQLCDLAKYPNVHVKTSAFYALGEKKPPYTDLGPMLERVLDAYGPQRLMWGSDSPFQVQPPHTYTASLELITEQLDFLTENDRQWILRKTAEKVFFQPWEPGEAEAPQEAEQPADEKKGEPGEVEPEA